MDSIPHFAGVYLIHMDSPLSGHAQHYIGWSTDVFERLHQHKHNQGARILEVCNERGITYRIARVWKGRTRSFERQLKNRKNARKLCPVCSEAARKYPTKRAVRAPEPFCLLADGTRCPF